MEIKRTVLPPFGGPREESGANGSLWSMGGKVIGSPEPDTGIRTFTPGNGYSSSDFYVRNQSDAGLFTLNSPSSELDSIRATIPGPFDNTDWTASVLLNDSILGTYPITAPPGSPGRFDAAFGADLSFLSPLYNEFPYVGMLYPITSISFNINAKTISITIIDPAVVGPTSNWYVDPMSSAIRFPGVTQLPAELNNPTQYKLVLSGGNIDGEWVLPNNVSISPMWGNILYIQWPPMTSDKPGGMSAGQFGGTMFDLNDGSPSTTVDTATASIVPV